MFFIADQMIYSNKRKVVPFERSQPCKKLPLFKTVAQIKLNQYNTAGGFQ